MAGTTVQVEDIREIFREVSPYITRQWKEVCRNLGVQEVELTQLENTFTTGLSNLAFKGLCLWYNSSGGAAKKERLVTALQRCGLRRAEDEIVNIEMKQLMVRPLSSASSRPTSRAMSGRRRIRTGYTGSRPSSGASVRTSKNSNPQPVNNHQFEVRTARSRPPSATSVINLYANRSRPPSGSNYQSQTLNGSQQIGRPPVKTEKLVLTWRKTRGFNAKETVASRCKDGYLDQQNKRIQCQS